MKFAFTSTLLLATLSAALAQSSSSTDASSSASATPSSSSASQSSSSSGSSQSTAAATCTLFTGNPKEQPFGCPEGAVTSTPPYNSESLQSYLIGDYTAGKEGTAIGQIASKLANSVTDYYPTLTVSYGAIVTQYEQALSASIKDYHKDAAPSSFNVPSSIGAAAMVAAAVVAGGAFVL